MVIGPWTYIGGRFRWKMTTCPSISIGVGGAMCVQGGGTSFPGGRVLLMPQILSKANPHTAKTMPATAAMHTSIPSQHEPASATHTRDRVHQHQLLQASTTGKTCQRIPCHRKTLKTRIPKSSSEFKNQLI